jgi:hypothetical protein
MPALYPMMVAAEEFTPGDCVRKFITDHTVTSFTGVVSHIVPATQKVWVQWPTEVASESPETLVKINPAIAGLPTALTDMGYSSYEKTRSDRRFGPSPLKPRMMTASEKMAVRIAHDFATTVVNKLVDEICACQEESLSDVKAYDRIYRKFGTICSDYIIRSSIKKVYEYSK